MNHKYQDSGILCMKIEAFPFQSFQCESLNESAIQGTLHPLNLINRILTDVPGPKRADALSKSLVDFEFSTFA